MQYLRIIDDAFAGISMGTLVALIVWVNFWAKNPKVIAEEEKRRAAVTQREREEDYMTWANHNSW